VRVKDLKTHPEPYVTVAELAEYWLVGRKQIYKQIDAGTLRAMRLGPRLLRIRTAHAIEFERRANMHRPSQRALEPAEQLPTQSAVSDGGNSWRSTAESGAIDRQPGPDVRPKPHIIGQLFRQRVEKARCELHRRQAFLYHNTRGRITRYLELNAKSIPYRSPRTGAEAERRTHSAPEADEVRDRRAGQRGC